MYTGDIIRQLDKIINIAKISMNEIAVFDYNRVAA
jgi:hypothetical protein